MRLTIIRDDNLIIKDTVGYHTDLSVFDDLSWIPGYDEKSWGKFHALQWYGDPDEFGEYGFGQDEPYGEIEFRKPVPNFIIKELGVYAQAINLWESAKVAAEEKAAEEAAELLRLQEEEEANLRNSYLDFDLEALISDL